MKIALVNHGCAKNLVDSELILGLLDSKGHQITLDETDADIVIVNTCSFIHDAEKESVDSILQLIDEGKKVIVAGCLSQKYNNELKEAIPEISGMIGATNIKDIVKIIDNLSTQNYSNMVEETPQYVYAEDVQRKQITVGASSYIKIADGCNYECGYCVIPKLRGKYVSRPIENIVKEAKELASKGVTEIVLIAQDTSSYGIDLYGKQALAQLLQELNNIDELSWIRIMYAYPTTMTDEIIEAIANLNKVVKYIDIPLQHSHPRILKEMKRPVMDYKELVKKFRVKFDRMGAFEYSREKGTYSDSLKPQISAKVKKERRNKLMELQQQISLKNNKKYIGQILNCIVEGFTDDGQIILRSEHDAPEIDGYVYAISKNSVVPGDIENVIITDADEYDLFGEIK